MTTKQKLEIANCDFKNIDRINIESLIRVIRGQQVMLDADLAMLYGVETKALNQAVKRNVNRFPDDFRFQLTQEEAVASRSQIATLNENEKSLRSQIVTLNAKDTNLKSQIVTSSWGGTRKRPYAFTRNGITMLSSVLKSETAVGVNIRIMRAFTMIPQLVNYNAQLVQRIFNIEQHQQETDEKIDVIIEKIEEISPEIEFVQLPQRNHDRFLIVDNKLFLLGASLKDIGTGLCAVTEMAIAPEVILELVKH